MTRKLVGLVMLWGCFAGFQAGAKGFDCPKMDCFELIDLEQAKDGTGEDKDAEEEKDKE